MLEGLGDIKMLEGFFNLSFVFRPGELLLKRVIFFSLFGVCEEKVKLWFIFESSFFCEDYRPLRFTWSILTLVTPLRVLLLSILFNLEFLIYIF
jgi:hypothetical protein